MDPARRGAVALVRGPARLVLRPEALELSEGRAFVDTNDGPPAAIDTPRGRLELSDARASVDVRADRAEVYVLRGAARAGSGARAGPGERLALRRDGAPTLTPETAWDDWTGGLATADPPAEPTPFGLGTVGARPPGDQGKPRFSLVVQRLDVRVTIDHDYATTEVDETFVNPSSDTVEGLFSFRTPPGAVLQRFGVDRNGDLVWGRVKESAAALEQYQSNVYAGSTEDPALLQWMAPGAYAARLNPINPRAQRRVVTRYAEWLPRQGPEGDRRLYVYPMAAAGARASLPRIEELSVRIDLAKAGAQRVRAGMGGKRDGDEVVIKAFDVVPLADLAVELFDGGQTAPVAYRAPHALSAEDAPQSAQADFASKVSKEEPDYLLVPLRVGAAPTAPGVDLAIVVDTSAATETGALDVARSLTSALLAQLGPADRAALWAGDATLHPVADGSGALTALDTGKRRAWLEGLAAVERGGATDIGALLTDAASKLDPARRGAVVYIGDGQPSVGEVAPKALRDRLARLPEGTRVFAAALGSNPNVALLQTVARGASVEVVGDAYAAAQSALRLLEAAYRPAWVGATVDLGPGVERILPRELPAVGPDEAVLVVGRVSGAVPGQIVLRGGGRTATLPLVVVPLSDSGDLRRRWGEQRLAELIDEGAGRAAIVDVSRRFGLVSPFTSLYVPTTREVATSEEPAANLDEDRASRMRRWKPWWRSPADVAATMSASADQKEGGTGVRAKGEEGSMGRPATTPAPTATAEAAQFGIIGVLGGDRDTRGATKAPAAAAAPMASAAAPPMALPPAPPMTATAAARATPEVPHRAGQAAGANADPLALGLGLKDVGAGGGGRGEGIGLGDFGNVIGDSFGSGGGRLGGAHASVAPRIREGATTVDGRLPREVVQRIVRQNFGRFRLCYDNGLRNHPGLQGRVSVKFVIGRTGAVTTATEVGSDLPDPAVVQCVVGGFGNLSFPQPESGLVTVVYPVVFAPGDGPAIDDPAPTITLAVIGHHPLPCSAGADLAFDERRTLWRERLGTAVNAVLALDVYRRALAGCEAPSWRERHALLLEMVSHLPLIEQRVALWRALLLDSPAAADVVYRATVLRVQTPEELHQLHVALGLRTIDPDLLAGLLARAKTPAARLDLLHATALKWPDDLELGLRVLDAYEDAGDDGGGRAWARRLRHRADATPHVFTNVGEYYLRLSSKEGGAVAARDADEARRTFGELVEFAPEDPVARRRLGDLLRAHGWYEEASRQYETLAQLAPDDAAVPLLLAEAAQGMGRIEEAVSWTEKAAAAGSPDGSGPRSHAARGTASAFLAWALDDASKGGRKEEADRLRARQAARGGRRRAGGPRPVPRHVVAPRSCTPSSGRAPRAGRRRRARASRSSVSRRPWCPRRRPRSSCAWIPRTPSSPPASAPRSS